MFDAAAVAENVPYRVSLPETCRYFEGIPSGSLRVKRGHSLFHAGDQFSSIYPIAFGSFKAMAVDREGRQQVTEFPLCGDVLGLDGIGSGRYTVTAVALEDSELVVLPFISVERAARDDRDLQRALCELLSSQIVYDHGVMMVLGSLRASERLAGFLLTLSRRFERRGYSAGEVYLRMGRADIGSYLGMKIETVSRMLTTFAERGLIELHDKHMRLLDVEGLEGAWKGTGLRIGREDRRQQLGEQAGMLLADARNICLRSSVARALSQSLRKRGETARVVTLSPQELAGVTKFPR